MKNLMAILLLLGVIAGGSAEAQPWTLQPCADTAEATKARADYALAVKRAEPNTPLFTPNPFPKTSDEVFENFVAFHTKAFADTPLDQLRPEERRLHLALSSGDVEYGVLKVENWTPLRCGIPKARRTWFLLRIFDARSGEELARATVDDVGHVGRLRHRPPEQSLAHVLDLEESKSTITEVAREARGAQYVATWGTVKCDELSPCVAMREGSKVLLLDSRRGELFLLDAESRRLSFRQDLSAMRRSATLRRAAQSDRQVVSLGGDAFAEVERLGQVENLGPPAP